MNKKILAGILIGLVFFTLTAKAKNKEGDESKKDDELPADLLAQFNNKSLKRSIRNNNPGNLIISNNDWNEKVPKNLNTDGTFEQFYQKKYGTRAMIKLLNNYITKLGFDTIQKIITRWSATDQQTYIDFVLNQLESKGWSNLDADTIIDSSDADYFKELLTDITIAISRFEAGIDNLTVSEFNEAYNLL